MPYDEFVGAESGLEVFDEAVYSPRKVEGVDDATQIATGGDHSCALLRDGTVKCWGLNTAQELGAATVQDFSTVPVTVGGLPPAIGVACGGSHSCALLSDGSVQCWGYNGDGELGAGAPTGVIDPASWTPFTRSFTSQTPLVVTGVSNAILLAAGDSNTCVVLASGEVQCWGAGYHSQLGSTVTTLSSTPVTIDGISAPTLLAIGSDFMCGLLSGGTMKCWGHNDRRQLPGAAGSEQPIPVDVIGLHGVTSIAAGYAATCVTITDGSAFCWGWGPFGDPNDQFSDAATGIAMRDLTGAVKISEGFYNGCALLSDGSPKCWGYAATGGVGNGKSGYVSTPQPVTATW
jgi:alpha-tubulin suppressor-like RCC1 family protein